MRNRRKGEISTVVLLGGVLIFAVGAFLSATLNQNKVTINSRAAASSACPYNSGQTIPLGGTETNEANTEPRWPISQKRHEYDVFGPGYFNLSPVSDEGVLNLTKNDGGHVDSKMTNFMGSMFGYKPRRLTAAYDMRYGNVQRDDPSPIKGDAPVLEIPIDPADPTVKVPSTGYDIGGGYEAMVVFATSDRVTIHIGRHEYFVGSRRCADGNTCSGGYWIYVKGICVDQKIQDAYNSIKGQQESAGATISQIQLPMVRPGQILGKATGTSVTVGVRDNGPFISTYKSVYWGGVPEKDVNVTIPPTAPPPTNPPGGGGQGGGTAATATLAPIATTQPTATHTPTHTPSPTPKICPSPYTLCPNNITCAGPNAPCPALTSTPASTNTPTPKICPSPYTLCPNNITCAGPNAPCPALTSTPASTNTLFPTMRPEPGMSSTSFTCEGKEEGSCYGPTTTGAGYISCNGGIPWGINQASCPNPNIPFCQIKGGEGNYCDGANIMHCRGVGDSPSLAEDCHGRGCSTGTNTCNSSQTSNGPNGTINRTTFTTVASIDTYDSCPQEIRDHMSDRALCPSTP